MRTCSGIRLFPRQFPAYRRPILAGDHMDRDEPSILLGEQFPKTRNVAVEENIHALPAPDLYANRENTALVAYFVKAIPFTAVPYAFPATFLPNLGDCLRVKLLDAA